MIATICTIAYFVVGLILAFFYIRHKINKRYRPELLSSDIGWALAMFFLWPPLLLLEFMDWASSDKVIWDFSAKKEKITDEMIKEIKEKAWAEGYQARSEKGE